MSGVTPATLVFSIEREALPSVERGVHLGRIVLDSDDPRGPHVIGVVLNPSCAPDCGARVCGRDPVCGESCGACPLGEACDPAGACSPIAPASCPSADLADQLGPRLVAASLEGGDAARQGSCGGEGRELSFRFAPARAGFYRLSTRSTDADGVFYARDGCDGDELACVATSDASAMTLSLRGEQEVVATVDSRVGTGRVYFGAQPAPCPDVDLGSTLGARLVEDRTDNLGGRMIASCGGAGEEAVFGWTAPAAGRYRIESRADGGAADFAHALHVRAGHCAGPELACTTEGALELDLARGQRIVIAVDADGASGRFALGIVSTAGACVGRCGGTPDQGGCFCDPACRARRLLSGRLRQLRQLLRALLRGRAMR